jgi:hypothetical protein
MQEPQLRDDEEQEEDYGPIGIQEVLQQVQVPQAA